MVQLNSRFTLLLALCLAVAARPATNGMMAEVGPIIVVSSPCSRSPVAPGDI
jgi:hypothetical protein